MEFRSEVIGDDLGWIDNVRQRMLGVPERAYATYALTKDLIKKGVEITRSVSGKMGIPLKFIGVSEECADLGEDIRGDAPLLVVGQHIGFSLESGADYGAFGI